MVAIKSFEYGFSMYLACAIIINNSHGNIINNDEVALSLGNAASREKVNLCC
jgi:hypothetical protein